MEFISLDNEEHRLKTFDRETWPHSFISPEVLSKNGFYYIGPFDKIECFYCGIRMNDWKDGDQVDFEHNKWSELCPFLMNSEENRLKTFDNWPHQHLLNPKDLAKSGMFYLGSKDEVQCNFCKIQLHQWDLCDDDIVFEHYRLSPTCMFLKKHESTRNIPIEPVNNTYKLLAPAIYADYTTWKTIKNKYVDIDVLKRGYYAVKNITFITSNGDSSRKKCVRVDLNNKKFVIIDLNTHKHINEVYLEYLKNSNNLVIMRKAWSELQFYETKNRPHYHSSELIDWEDLSLTYKQYKVLLFSIVEIHDEKRIRVDIYNGKYFILPELEHTPRVYIDDLESWNEKRWKVRVTDHLFEGPMVHFSPEQSNKY